MNSQNYNKLHQRIPSGFGSLDKLTSELEQELLEIFSNQSEFLTFLRDHPSSTILQQMETSSISMEMKNFNLCESICSMDPEAFFFSCFLVTMRRYIGSNSLTFCIPVSNSNQQQLFPVVTNLETAMNGDLVNYFQFVKHEMDLFKNFKDFGDFSEISRRLEKSYDIRPYSHMFSYNTKKEESVNQMNPKVAFSLEVNVNLDENENLTADGVSFVLKWRKPLLNDQVAKLFLSNYINCCQILCNFDASLSKMKELDIMCQEEKNLLASFQTIQPQTSSLSSVCNLFEKNFLLNPNKVAIYEDSALTSYAQLYEASCKIASAIKNKFTQVELSTLPVVLVMEKNWECIASVFGVWLAGGFFHPIDSSMQEKLSSLSNSEVLCVLTNLEKDKLSLPVGISPLLQVKELISQQNVIDHQVDFQHTMNFTGPAYMTKTSGSTGKPKKCVVSHNGLSQFAFSVSTQFGLDDSTNLLQWVPFSFDVFIGDLIKALVATNGSLTMVSSMDRGNVHKIASLVSKYNVNFIQTTPQFAAFALEQEPNLMEGVKSLALGGESFEWKTLQRIRNHLEPSTKLYNCYGLTEATVESTVFQLPSEQSIINAYQKECRYVPIGQPLPQIPVYVLDPITLLQTPVGGFGGILAITGPTVGSIGGNNNSTTMINGLPTFLSGDSVSWLPNGVLDYRGRDNEQMIKVTGGFRINCPELESKIMEIGALISNQMELTQVVVLGFHIQDDDSVVLAAALQIQGPETKAYIKTLQTELRKVLPYFMVPQIIISSSKFPLTPNGKVNRKSLESQAARKYKQLTFPEEQDDIKMTKTEAFLVKKLIQVCGRTSASMNTEMNLRDQGLTSFQLMKFANILVAEGVVSNFNGISDLFNYPTIKLLAQKLDSTTEAEIINSIPKQINNSNIIKSAADYDPICIVGMSFRLPGNIIGSIPDFWNAISQGSCFVRDFPENRAEDVLTRMTEPYTSDCVRASYFASVDKFDHEFFSIAPNEAKHMCPEQRIFLEVGTEALIDAGYSLASLDNANIGVYATATDVQYGIIDTSLDGVAVVGRQSAVVPSRLSYTFNLKGGNYVVDTACSAALTTLEQAVRDLKAGQCETAIVGGANIYLYPATDGLMGTNLIHSATSCCQPFDEDADGTVSGEGVFAYVLKKRSDALANGDYIYCNIESVCSNGVGRGNGITAPSVDSQVQVIQNAISAAGITVDEIDFLETHGTGTVLGDQIELCALGTAFTSREKPLPIGATKQSYGHLDMVAGFLSILKASSALRFNTSLTLKHINNPSKYLERNLFQTEATELRDEFDRKSYAGVSAYGLSGTNCHTVISVETTATKTNNNSEEIYKFLLPMEEIRRCTLEEQCSAFSRYAKFYQDKSSNLLADICGTQVANLINSIRKDKTKEVHRVAVISASSVEELIKKFDAIAEGISVISNNQIETLDRNKMSEFLPLKSSWSRVPALPKFVFKNVRHWLNPVEQKKPEIKQNQLASFASLLQNKSTEIHALLETAHKLEQMINQFSFGFMSDLLKDDFKGLPQKKKSELKRDELFDRFHINGEISKECNDSGRDSALSSLALTPSESDESLNLREPTYEATFQKIAKIWEDCLGLDKIQGSDIFRELGGDSLLTVQMAKTVSSIFGVKIKAADAFANPTLSLFTSLVFQTSFCHQQDIKDLSQIDISSFSSSKEDSSKFIGMPTKMIMFPGQGSQKVQMCQSMLNCPYSSELFEKAKEITGIDILSNCTNPDAFQSTEFVQVALFVGSLAKIAQLKAENPSLLEGIRAVSGLSVGEFAALVFADAIDFEDALKIVHFRGKVMQEEIDSFNNKTGMVSVFGPEPKSTEFQEFLKNFPDMKFSTFLGDNQFTLGGPIESCERLTSQLTNEVEAERLGVIDARLLRVAGAFHTDYMKKAGVKTAAMIDTLNIRWPKLGIVMNVDGALAMNKESIRFNLKKQTSAPVLWRDVMKTAHGLGIRNFVEISPSSVLTPILKKRIQGMNNCDAELVRF